MVVFLAESSCGLAVTGFRVDISPGAASKTQDLEANVPCSGSLITSSLMRCHGFRLWGESTLVQYIF